MKLNHVQATDIDHLSSPAQLLKYLGGPSEIVMEGKDMRRTRVIVTLLHGNEPSGITAILAYLKSGDTPTTRTVFIVASVAAALTPPQFFYRMLPEQPDLNRCFGGSVSGCQGALATSIKATIERYKPEVVVDMHNTSGDGPAFCVSTQSTSAYTNLASHFSHRCIITDITLGSLMEQDFNCPIITFEAGGSDNDKADTAALRGLTSLLSTAHIDAPVNHLELLKHPRRLELQPGISVCYHTTPNASECVTLRSDIEQFNFGITPRNTALGWVNQPLEYVFKLDKWGHLLSRFFYIQDQQIVTKEDLRLFMVTTREDIAQSDCLFYFQS